MEDIRAVCQRSRGLEIHVKIYILCGAIIGIVISLWQPWQWYCVFFPNHEFVSYYVGSLSLSVSLSGKKNRNHISLFSSLIYIFLLVVIHCNAEWKKNKELLPARCPFPHDLFSHALPCCGAHGHGASPDAGMLTNCPTAPVCCSNWLKEFL